MGEEPAITVAVVRFCEFTWAGGRPIDANYPLLRLAGQRRPLWRGAQRTPHNPTLPAMCPGYADSGMPLAFIALDHASPID